MSKTVYYQNTYSNNEESSKKNINAINNKKSYAFNKLKHITNQKESNATSYNNNDENDDDNEMDAYTNNEIKEVEFVLAGPEEIRRKSVAALSNFANYERGLPKANSALDVQMGTCDKKIRCATCKNKLDACPGHEAHIELPFPVFHSWCFPTTLKILRCVCFFCNRLLLADNDARLARIVETTSGKQRCHAIYQQTKTKTKCPRCSYPQPNYRKQPGYTINLDWSEYTKSATKKKITATKKKKLVTLPVLLERKMKQPFTAAAAQRILQAIPDIDYARMGIDPRTSHPSFQIIKALAVAPPAIRPPISASEGSNVRGQDDLTCSLADILSLKKTYNKTKENVGKILQEQKDLKDANNITDELNHVQHQDDKPNRSDSENHQIENQPKEQEKEKEKTKKHVNFFQMRKERLLNDLIKVDTSTLPSFEVPTHVLSAAEIEALVEPTERNLTDVPRRHLNDLQIAVAVLQSNNVKGLNKNRKRSGKDRASIMKRLKGKYGRFRLTVHGKRVDYSARTVIGPDPYIDSDQVGVPEKICNTLTLPISVTDFNKEDLQARVRRGANVTNGALMIECANGKVVFLDSKENCVTYVVKIGDVVHRHIKDGDPVIFNRQPSLHKLSMMVFKTVVIKGDTIRFNWTVTSPFNADFDGDEMNLHYPQDYLAMAEMVELMSVSKLVVDPAKNKTAWGPIQDAVVGSFLLTQDDVFFTKEEVMQYMMQRKHVESGIENMPPPAILRPVELWTGKQVFSLLIPDKICFFKNVNTEINNTILDDNKELDSWIKEKCMIKVEKSLSATSFKIKYNGKHYYMQIFDTFDEYMFYTHDDCLDVVVDNAEDAVTTTTTTTTTIDKQSNQWKYFKNYYYNNGELYVIVRDLMESDMFNRDNVVIDHGELLSGVVDKSVMGIAHGSLNQLIYRDCGERALIAFNSDLVRLINYFNTTRGFTVGIKDSMISLAAKVNIKRRIEDIKNRMASMQHPDVAGHIPKAILENSLQAVANKSLQVVGAELIKHVDVKKNAILQMVRSGAKGNEINPINICGLVGQQNACGKRIEPNKSHKLPSFAPCDLSPESHGFIDRPYISGLTPEQFFYHCICGCDGLVDTACHTSDTGYIQRRLQAAMECNQVFIDGTVRKISDGKIISLSYGADGFDASFMEKDYMNELENPALCAKLAVSEEQYLKFYEIDENNIDVVERKAKYKQQCAITQKEAENFKHLIKLYTDQETNMLFPRISSEIHVPVNFQRMLLCYIKPKSQSNNNNNNNNNNVNNIKHGTSDKKDDDASSLLLPSELLKLRRDLLTRLKGATKRFDNGTLWKLLVTKYLSSRIIIFEKRATRSEVNTIIQKIFHEFNKARVAYGEMVGSVAADSLGATSTQSTLNTFHYAGLASTSVHVTQGVPRMNEILAVSKKMKTPSMLVALKKPYSSSERGARIAQRFLEHMTLSSVVCNVDYLTLQDFVLSNNSEALSVYPIVAETDASNIIIHLKLSQELLLQKEMTPMDIKRSADLYLNGMGITHCSDYMERNWYLSVRLLGIHKMAEKLPSKSVQIEQSICRRFLHFFLTQCFVAGVPNIKRAVPFFGENDEWYLQTQGSAMKEIQLLEFVDFERCTTNHIYEASEVLGIDAASLILKKELHNVISSDGQYINMRHITELVDTMCREGFLMSCNRHGINKVDKSVFSKVSFEEQIEVLTEASIYSHKDKITGIKETNTIGTFGNFGTGVVHVFARKNDLKKQQNANALLKDQQKQQQQQQQQQVNDFLSSFLKDDDCNDEDTPKYTPASPTLPHMTTTTHVNKKLKLAQDAQGFTSICENNFAPVSPEYQYNDLQINGDDSMLLRQSPDYQQLYNNNNNIFNNIHQTTTAQTITSTLLPKLSSIEDDLPVPTYYRLQKDTYNEHQGDNDDEMDSDDNAKPQSEVNNEEGMPNYKCKRPYSPSLDDFAQSNNGGGGGGGGASPSENNCFNYRKNGRQKVDELPPFGFMNQ